jgi:anti-anti-sigma factor
VRHLNGPGPDLPPFDARLVRTEREVAVVVQGEIDLATCDRLWPVIEQALSQGSRLVLDLENTTFIDSSGLALIIRAHRRLGQLPEALVIRAPRPAARKLLGVSGIDRLVTVEGPHDGTGGADGHQPDRTDGSALT